MAPTPDSIMPAVHLVVIGCGNPNRSDDGAGVVAAQRLGDWLKRAAVEGVSVFDAGTSGMEVLYQARGARALIIVDACRSGAAPGSLFRLPANEIDSPPAPSYSLHDFRWDHALYAGRQIFGPAFPTDATVYLIEAGDLSFGLELTPAVARAVDRLVEAITREIEQRTGRHGSDAPAAVVRLQRGTLLLDASLCSRYFPGRAHLVLRREGERLLIAPAAETHPGASRTVQTAAGDRVMDGRAFLREQGLDEERERVLPLWWDPHQAALVTDWSAVIAGEEGRDAKPSPRPGGSTGP